MLGISQCGWRIWHKPKRFTSHKDMVQWIFQYCEDHPDKLGPDGSITMVGYDETETGPMLRSLGDWNPSLLSQIHQTSTVFVLLQDLEEEVFSENN